MTYAGYDAHDSARRAAEPRKQASGPASAPRGPFTRDRARVLHSAALRRLAAKTQVVEIGAGDFPRTRLTHSLECAQIGRELGAALGCDPDLVDTACLAHDLGHPPFGHNGEAALAELAGGIGGFEGNAQSLRLLTRLEAKIPGAGLNLTRATLDATVKYPWGPGPAKFGHYPDDAEVFAWVRERAPVGRSCLEAQVMDWADDVAYSVHDLEDGLHAGHVTLAALRDGAERRAVAALAAERYLPPGSAAPAELEEVFRALIHLPWWPDDFDGGPRSLAALKHLTSELIARFCGAAERATLAAAAAAGGAGAGAGAAGSEAAGSEAAGSEAAGFEAAGSEAAGGGAGGVTRPRLTRYASDLAVPRRERLECAMLKGVTAHYVMSRPGAADRQARQRELIAELTAAVEAGAPGTLDPALRPAFRAAGSDAARSRVVVDQIASLTDTSAMAWHARLCGPVPRPG